MATVPVGDEEEPSRCCGCYPQLRVDFASLRSPVEVEQLTSLDIAFSQRPFMGPLLFQNESSDARDHCANERTFLSYLRLSVYMAVVSVSIVISFRLKGRPSDAEIRMAKPLGAIFWALSVLCLLVGLANYIRTINKYSRKAAIVQTGWKTQVIMATIGISIVGTSVALLVVARLSGQDEP